MRQEHRFKTHYATEEVRRERTPFGDTLQLNSGGLLATCKEISYECFECVASNNLPAEPPPNVRTNPGAVL
jgi:hypothetical protein